MTSLAATLLAVSRSPLAVLGSLPRLRGRVGEGDHVSLDACPLPVPPPQAGEGTPGLQSLFNRKSARP